MAHGQEGGLEETRLDPRPLGTRQGRAPLAADPAPIHALSHGRAEHRADRTSNNQTDGAADGCANPTHLEIPVIFLSDTVRR
jgi:hypothetical protein